MSETELLSLCSPENVKRWGRARNYCYYWTSEIYGFGRYIRQYAYYPEFLPLCAYTDHGPFSADTPLKHELESDAAVQFYHSKRLVAEWEKVSKKPCYVLYSPFVFYRRKNTIEPLPQASGTLVYPAHSTADIDDENDIDLYIEQILSLPDIYHPISVCLHMHDVNKGQHKIFRKYKIPVYTAGNSQDYRFAERFYAILRNFKYSTSNLPMSCLFYSVEMGIPHFIYGNRPCFNNKGNTNISAGRDFDPLKEWTSFQELHDLFYGPRVEITPRQRQVVEAELGLHDGVTRFQLMLILYKALFQSLSSSKLLTIVGSRIKKQAAKIFS